MDFNPAKGVCGEGPDRHLFTDIIIYAHLRQIYAKRKRIPFYVLDNKHLFFIAFPATDTKKLIRDYIQVV